MGCGSSYVYFNTFKVSSVSEPALGSRVFSTAPISGIPSADFTSGLALFDEEVKCSTPGLFFQDLV